MYFYVTGAMWVVAIKSIYKQRKWCDWRHCKKMLKEGGTWEWVTSEWVELGVQGERLYKENNVNTGTWVQVRHTCLWERTAEKLPQVVLANLLHFDWIPNIIWNKLTCLKMLLIGYLNLFGQLVFLFAKSDNPT